MVEVESVAKLVFRLPIVEESRTIALELRRNVDHKREYVMRFAYIHCDKEPRGRVSPTPLSHWDRFIPN